MQEKNLVLVVVGHQGYISHSIKTEKDYIVENDILFKSISDTYLPLINLFHKLEEDNVSFKIALVLSPVLCELFSDPVIQEQYIEWLDGRIALGKKEVERCKYDVRLQENAIKCLNQAEKNKYDFTEVYNQNLIKQFAEFAKKGYIELLATAGTYGYLPHYKDLTEVLNAQVEVGLHSHRHFFGSMPEGFWLPYMGYDNGIEKVVRSYGINYTILDTSSILFSQDTVDTGIFSPVRCRNSLVVFGRDPETPEDITNEDDGFMSGDVYKDQERDIAFELPSESLTDVLSSSGARVSTLYRYWSKDNKIYDETLAYEQLVKDAQSFVTKKAEKLEKAASLLPEQNVSLVCTIPAELLGNKWAEGIDFLDYILRNPSGYKYTGCSDLLSNQFTLPRITPFPGAASGSGFGEDLLDSTNEWMIRYIRKMCERMVDLSGRFPEDTGLKVRLLNLGAKELLLAQSGEWPRMLHDGQYPEYVTKVFKENVKAFTTVFDSLGSNTVSTEWLTTLEKEHKLFPWINYRIFSKKM